MIRAQFVAALLIGAAVVLKSALAASFSVSFSGILFLPAVIVSAYLGGRGSGLATMALSCVAIWFASGSIGPPVAWADLAVFSMIAAAGAWLAALLREERELTLRVLRDLERREAFLKSLLDAIPDAVIAASPEGRVLAENAGARRIFDPRNRTSLLGRSIRSLLPGRQTVPPEAGTAGEGVLDAAADGGKTIRLERADGSLFAADVSAGSWGRDMAGNRTYIISDVTRRQELLHRLRRAEEELTRLMRSAERSEVISLLSHELNQPLSALLNYILGAQALLSRGDGCVPQQLQEALDNAAEQAVRASRTIYQMRDFLVSGGGTRKREEVEPLLREALEIATSGNPDPELVPIVEISAPGAAILANRLQIQLVLVNVIRNALEAMQGQDRRFLAVRVDTTPMRVTIRVIDTGPGIPEPLARNLFKPLTTTKPAGMGIGLSAARQVIESHDGTITLQNRPGGGAECLIELPLAPEAEPAHA